MMYILLGIIAFIILIIIILYNHLISLKHRVEEAWSDIEVQLKRRHDLVPNLMEAVRGYMSHERDLFEKVTEARAKAIGAGNQHEKMIAENALSSTLKTLFAVAENYPDLKANTNFIEFQRELSDTENKIQAARRFYNSNVRDFNIAIESFPSNIIASFFKFNKREFFDMDEREKTVPEVKF